MQSITARLVVLEDSRTRRAMCCTSAMVEHPGEVEDAMTNPEGFYTTVHDEEDFDRYADYNTEDNT